MANQASSSSQIISLPKGGGAQQGMGEKFSPDPFTGTGNFSVPIALPSGRNGFQPQLALAYSTGNGNGLFGLGWSLSIPGVTRKSSKGIPRYRDDTADLAQRDTFILSGAEDLVPITALDQTPLQYRPRTEGLFALIEHHRDARNDFWRVATKDGLVSWYGTPQSPQAAANWSDTAVIRKPKLDTATRDRNFAWKLTLTKDPFGNRIEYLYEDRDKSVAADRQFGRDWDQPLLSQIRYLDYEEQGEIKFLVSVQFEYESRSDAFSDYRSGFEIRTTRRCKAILIKTHADNEYAVRRYEFDYSNQTRNGASHLQAIRVVGFDDQGNPSEELPPLEFGYSDFNPQDLNRRDFYPIQGADLPAFSLADPSFDLVDLCGNGLPDILEMGGSMRYWRNLGGGRFDIPHFMQDAPAGLALADVGVQLIDANGDGRADLLVTQPGLAGYFPMEFGAKWDRRSLRKYEVAPSFDLKDPEVRLVDLTGDGVTDAIRSSTRLECYFNDPEKGWHATRRVERQTLAYFPNVNFSDPRVKWSDMAGDGLQDIVLVHDGNLAYWPNLGYGDWGKRIQMRNSPRFPLNYDPKRILLGDIDGDGLADLIYLDDRKIHLWINQSGNAWSDEIIIHGTPSVSDMDATRLIDLLGTGVVGVLWTKDVTQSRRDNYFFLDLTGGTKPYLLQEMNNNMGAVTRVGYAPSTQFYLADEKYPKARWKTPLPFPVQVVAQVEVIDELSRGKHTTEYTYHHGYWDGVEREFRGFARVEQFDTESFDNYDKAGLHGADALFAAINRQYFSPPTYTKTWFHPGPVDEESGGWKELDLTKEYWGDHESLLAHATEINDFLKTLSRRRTQRDALRALRGSVLRSELYALDGTEREDRPYSVTEQAYGLRQESPPTSVDTGRLSIFFAHAVAQRTTQWERGDDPLTSFSYTSNYDDYGQPRRALGIACPRGWRAKADALPSTYLATLQLTEFASPQVPEIYIHDRVAKTTGYELINEPEPDTARSLQQIIDLAELPENCRLIAQSLNFYDGDINASNCGAFLGLPYGQVGRYGVGVRSNALVVTDEILQAAYETNVPPYLIPGVAINATAEYPAEFLNNLPALGGYNYQEGGFDSPYARGYFTTAAKRYDFHTASGTGQGMLLAQRDSLGHDTGIAYDPYKLFPIAVTDPAGLITRAEYNYRVMQPWRVTDINDNVSEIAFTPSGLMKASWVKGKLNRSEGDRSEPGTQLQYGLRAFYDSKRTDPGNPQPVYVHASKRVFHDTDPDGTAETIETRDYSDGFGRLLQTRTQAEDVLFGNPLRGNSVLPVDQENDTLTRVPVLGRGNTDHDNLNVIVSGWQIYDNKGRVVEKYEPFFDSGWEIQWEQEAKQGVYVAMYYDPRGQVIRTVNPDGSEQRVVYGVPLNLDDPTDPSHVSPTPWEAYSYDSNDNAGRTHGNDSLTATYRQHWNTPASIEIDALGRTIKAIARHRNAASGAGASLSPIENHVTQSSYDIQGNLRSISDALGRTAFHYTYDLAKQALRTESIDAGTKQIVLNVVGNPIEGRDAKGAIALHTYDALNRPTQLWARDDSSDWVRLREKLIYGDNPGVPDSLVHNLRGKLYQHYDEAGVVTVADYDFKGNALESSRKLISDDFMLTNLRAHTGPDWSLPAPQVDWATQANILDSFEYRTRSTYDGLNRIKWSDYPQAANGERYRLRPGYNRAGALESVDLEGPLLADDTGPRQRYVQRLAYNAKGQRMLIAYGNGKMTRYAYDPNTFRLVRMRTENYSQPSALAYQFTNAQATNPVLQDLAYQYDLSGNILRIVDRSPGAGVRNNPQSLAYPELQTLLVAGDALVREFAYDPLYRLIAASGRECSGISSPRPANDDSRCGYNSGNHGTANQDNAPNMTSTYAERYEYDPAGNMLKLMHTGDGNNGWSRCFGMAGFTPKVWKEKVAGFLAGDAPDLGEQGNRLTNFGHDDEQRISHAYDANGNMLRENTERHFEWDYCDRMKAFRNQTDTAKPTTYALYLYDAAGRRVKKLVVEGNGYRTTTYLGTAFEHHAEYTQLADGEKIENCSLHVMDDKSRIAIVRVGEAFESDGVKVRVQYHLGDHLGSSGLVIGGEAATDSVFINREEFFPYGETSFGSFGRKRYRFTGKERDEESGLNYHGMRYLSLPSCRWISCDPAGVDPMWSIYVYARNSPLIYRDPKGTDSVIGDQETNMCSSANQDDINYESDLSQNLDSHPNTDFTPIYPPSDPKEWSPFPSQPPLIKAEPEPTKPQPLPLSMPFGSPLADKLRGGIDAAFTKLLTENLASKLGYASGIQVGGSFQQCFIFCFVAGDVHAGIYIPAEGSNERPSLFLSGGGTVLPGFALGPQGKNEIYQFWPAVGISSSEGFDVSGFVSQASTFDDFSGWAWTASGGAGPVSVGYGVNMADQGTVTFGHSFSNGAGIAGYPTYTVGMPMPKVSISDVLFGPRPPWKSNQ
jgi:RHS repeat-associated protein